MTPENKRKHERIKSLNLSYICLDEANNIIKQGMGRTLNISQAGILLETHFPIEPEHIVRLTISLEEDLLDIKGKLVHIRTNQDGKYEIGIEFIERDQPSIEMLKKFMGDGGVKNEFSANEED